MTQLERACADLCRLVSALVDSFVFVWMGSLMLIHEWKPSQRDGCAGISVLCRISLDFMICNCLINTCKVLIAWLMVISWFPGWDAGNKGWIHLVNNAVCLTKTSLMCSWICCRRDDPSLCMCPGWPWFCIHYPWVEAARTLEFKRGSLLLTSTCILYRPWLYEISYNPIYVSWGVRAKHNTGNNTVSGDTKVTCCVDVTPKLCQRRADTHMNKHNHVGGLWLDCDWQVSEALTGVMELTIRH